MLNSGEIAQMRDTIEQTLPSTAVILRATTTRDARGGVVPTWGTASSVACRWSPLQSESSAELDQSERIVALRSRMVTVPAGTDVTAADRVSIGGTVLEVMGVRSPRDYELSCRVECAEIV